MADISKIKLAGESTARDLKDAEGRRLIGVAEGKITAEETRAKGVEGGLDTRISNLEARGRYLSTWNVETGLPADYPTIPAGATSPYTYTYKTGDYYIINNVPESGTKYMPDGVSITATKSGDTWSWIIGKTEFVEETALVVGGQFLYSTSGWNYVATAKDVAWGNITGTLADQTDLKNALDEKQDADELKALAFAATATGSTTLNTIDSITMNDVTVSGNATVTHTATAASLTKGDYTPSGSLLVDSAAQAAGNKVLKGGSITVTLKNVDASATSITYGAYTPAGSVSLAASETGSFQVAGTNESSTVTVNTSNDTFVKSLKAGTVDAASVDTSKFDGGSAATWTGATYTAASYSHSGFSGGSFTKGTAVKATTEGIVASMGTGDDAETLIFAAAATDDVMDHDASFTAATYGTDTFTGGSVDFGTFNGGSAASISSGFFSSQKLPVVDGTASALTGVTSATAAAQVFTGSKYAPAFNGTSENIKATAVAYKEQAIDTASFSGTEAALSFSGAKASEILVTGVSYDKADASAAYSTTVTPTTKTLTKTAKTITITANPDA